MSDKLKPDDVITVTVNDFETKYVSRVSYDELRARAEKAEADAEQLREEMTNALEMITRAHVGPGDVVQKRLNAENYLRGWLIRRVQMSDVYYPFSYRNDAGKE